MLHDSPEYRDYLACLPDCLSVGIYLSLIYLSISIYTARYGMRKEEGTKRLDSKLFVCDYKNDTILFSPYLPPFHHLSSSIRI